MTDDGFEELHISISIYSKCGKGFHAKVFKMLSEFQQSDLLIALTVEDLDKDGPDAFISPDWKEDNKEARAAFSQLAMEHFNRYPECYTILSGEQIDGD